MGLDPTQDTGSIFTYPSFSRKIFRAPKERDGAYYNCHIDGAHTVGGEYPLQLQYSHIFHAGEKSPWTSP